MKYNKITEAIVDISIIDEDGDLHGFVAHYQAGAKGVTSIHAYDEGVAIHRTEGNFFFPWHAVHSLRYS